MRTLTLPATLDALEPISLFISEAAAHVGLDDQTTWQIQLAVDEAATNIIQHAYDTTNPGVITLGWQCKHERLTLTLHDQGRGFDPDNVPQPDLFSPLEDRQVGGLGIYLMTRLMDEVHFHFDPRSGNVLTMIKQLQPHESPDLTVLPLYGRLDALNAPQFSNEVQELLANGVRVLVVDLCGVFFLNSSGLQALLLAREELRRQGGELALAALQPQVHEVFVLTGFTQVFAMYATVAEARAAMQLHSSRLS